MPMLQALTSIAAVLLAFRSMVLGVLALIRGQRPPDLHLIRGKPTVSVAPNVPPATWATGIGIDDFAFACWMMVFRHVPAKCK